MPNLTISVIVPCWKEPAPVMELANEWASFPAVLEVIVAGVKGDKTGEPPSAAERVKWCMAERPGRGSQMNLGAGMATGDILLFHHADSHLTAAHIAALGQGMREPRYVGGAFYRKFDERHPHLRRLENLERLHCRLFGTLYGDQSIFVRRDVFAGLGGFVPIPLMEDVDFSGRLRRCGSILMLDPPMQSSPRRHMERGAWSATLQNMLFLALFRCGISPLRLHRRYYTATLPLRERPAAMNIHRLTKKEVWRRRWNAFRHPIAGEKADILKERWASFPPELRTPNQISGRHLTHCGFILGASYCSFHCTHCYLPKNANQVPIPSLGEVKEQIDANRRFQGPGGGLQITGGDVADAYWRAGRADELVEIIRYAYSAGLVPMLMTHGQTLLEQPEFLRRLVVEGGLRQVSVHIDITQAGRHGYPINRVQGEADLHPVREAFTKLARDIRETTGLPLEFALSFTVTRKNVQDLPEVIRWYLADPERTRIWRMISFQPEADTGRTIFSENPATPKLVWQKICEGTGFELERDGTFFGHPDCNSWASILVSRRTGKYIALLPTDKVTKRLLGELLARVGGLSLVTDDAGTPPWRLMGVLAQNPLLAARTALHLVALVVSGRLPFGMVKDLLRGQAHTLGVGTHNFMDAATVAKADTDPVVKARLDACVFKGAVKENGEWKATPMCRMNERKWSEVYAERLNNPALRQEKEAEPPVPEEAAAPNG